MEKAPVRWVLHVDDDYDMLESTKVSLHRLGYNVVSASSASEAIHLFEKHDFDVALLDIYMPGMDGIGLLRSLRNVAPGLPIIMFTGALGNDELFDSVNSGCDGFVEKPAIPEQIDEVIKHCLRKKADGKSGARG